MYNIPEQVSSFSKSNVDAVIGFAGIAAAGTQRFVDFQIQIAKAVFADSIAQAKAVAGAKDPQELVSLSTVTAQPAAEKAAAYVQHVYAIAAQTQSEIGAFVEKHIAEANRTLATLIDETAKHAPAGSESAVAAAKSAMSAANQAYDAISKVGKQVAEVTEATLQSVAKAGLQAANSVTSTTAGKKKAA